MATISTLYKTGATHPSAWGSATQAYCIENTIDLEDVIAAKGSAIAQGDVIQAIYVPAGSQVLFAGFQQMTVMTGTSTDATLDFGVTGGDVDCWVDGYDLDAGTANAYAAAASASITPAQTFFATADTLDLLVATQTGTILTGKLRVFAHILDVSSKKSNVGIATVGS